MPRGRKNRLDQKMIERLLRAHAYGVPMRELAERFGFEDAKSVSKYVACAKRERAECRI